MISSARLGDKHVCPMPGHGTTSIASASDDTNINFMGAARVGDTCGCGAVITTGFPSIQVNGRPMAHLGSPTSHGGTIITGSGDVGGGFVMGNSGDATIIDFMALGVIRPNGTIDEEAMSTLLADSKLKEKAIAANALVTPATEHDGSAETTDAISPKGAEPGFYIVQEPMSRSALEAELFEKRDEEILEKFRRLNPHLTAYAKPGQLIVLSDPKNQQCTREEALLTEAAGKVNAALKPMSDEEAGFMARHRDVIESVLSQGSTSIGIGEAIFAKNLDDLKNSLKDIEILHQRSFQRDGHLQSPEFFAERKRLFAQLDSRLTFLTKKGVGFPDHLKLKAALGISSRSLVHHWNLAGAPGQIPGYATHSDGVAKAAKFVKYGGWIGTAIGGGTSYLKVQDVCTAGNTEACARIKYTESGSFIGGVAGGAAAGAALTGTAVSAICVGLGVPTGGVGTLLCGVVVVGVGSYAGGALAGAGGEALGEVVYETVK
jgi:uncharacterized Zn-binding protein involved in type VI secretion